MADSAMSNEPILLFLHGVGDGDQNDNWKVALSESLTALGYPSLDQIRTIAPKYAHALKGWDDGEALPAVTVKQPSGEAAKQNRRDFERRMGAIEFRLGRHNHGDGLPGGDAIIDAAVAMLPQFDQARNYLKDAYIRAQVLNRILAKLPKTGRIVILGHSLGSVVAADLVPRLPVGLQVVGMVTIGSPLANGTFEVDKLRETLNDPPTNLAWWVNFWNTSDLVSAHRGVSSVFPWMIDFRIDTKNLFPQAHFAVNYLANEATAAALGFALFGSRSKELAEINTGVDLALDSQERTALLALRYAHLRKMRLEGDQKDRFTGALRQVQATAIDEIERRNTEHDGPLHPEIALLAFDVTDPQATLPEPQPSRFFTKDQAVVLLTVLAAENVIRPFEITISRDKWQETMEELAAEMGLTSRFGTDVFTAARLAQEALSDKKGVNWVKWGAIGVGAAAIVVATGGLALAAAPGLVGAAVVTSALASFGPGGMIGGLLMAGTLVTAGGGGIAYGLASPGTTAETLEAIVERRLAAAILRKLQHLDQDPAVWRVLAEAEIEVRREYERLDEFSDESSPVLKELKRKIVTIERALKYLKENGLEPTVPEV